ncbi:MAG: hypothetical protein ACRDDF_10495, partial [Aeromonas sp.]
DSLLICIGENRVAQGTLEPVLLHPLQRIIWHMLAGHADQKNDSGVGHHMTHGWDGKAPQRYRTGLAFFPA